MWLGEYQLGDQLPLTLWIRSGDAPTLPDSAPRAIVSNYTKQLHTLELPVTDTINTTALFHTTICLDGKFAAGEHIVQYRYAHSSTEKSEIHRFNILSGGDASATGIAIEYFAVNPTRYVLVQNDCGALIRRRNPSITA